MATLDDATVQAAAEGDHTAYALIWHALAGRVHGYLEVRGVPDPDAVTSDVFLAVFRALPTVTGGVSGLRTLTFSIAHARVVDHLRRRAARPLAVSLEATGDPREAASAEDEALRRSSAQDVRHWLDALPPDQRDVLTLRFLSELSLEETAATMRRSVGAVKQLQRRALRAVRAVGTDPAEGEVVRLRPRADTAPTHLPTLPTPRRATP